MDVEAFIAKYWGKKGGAERAVYQMFLTEFAQLLGAPTPDTPESGTLGDYQFEGPVKSEAALGTKGTGRIDLYKRGSFILEAKQSQLKPGETIPDDPAEEATEIIYDLFGNPIGHAPRSGKRAPKYDRLMADARIQAERYALALPDSHRAPPFLIVADIGRCFELYFDWSGTGRGYRFFPDQQNYRISLEQLRAPETRDLLRGLWLDPASVDPRLKAAEVTRDIAVRLSRVAAHLEEEQRKANPGKDDGVVSLGIEATSLFLMRVLFCMFAEDVELLPKGSFTAFLKASTEKSDQWWRSGLDDLWRKMNASDAHNRFWSYGDAIIRYFNGNLFAATSVYDLATEFRGELHVAATKDWRSVEPAIFGTLLEQVLTPTERAKLGAHYTPRPYVQRLVSAVISDVLDPQWQAVREAVRTGEGGVEMISAFHTHLATLRILDPACGTGNFLYVSMELLLQLESECVQLAAELGTVLEPRVHPNQFLGLELNPRAAVIAELVLWIGWLRHRLANHPQAIGDPVLPTLTNINGGTHGGFDAVLCRTATGEPDVANPRAPDWPEADFIIGNPPFIAGQDLREELGSDYAEALWKANPRVSGSADYVMQWWDRAAHILTTPDSQLQRFGFVTTNSITQTFSRRVIEGYLAKSSPERGGGGEADGGGERDKPDAAPSGEVPAPPPLRGSPPRSGEDFLSLILAIPDHPWVKPAKKQPDIPKAKNGSGGPAAVRIAMTVAQRGEHPGKFITTKSEGRLDSDSPEVDYHDPVIGRINADLTTGTDVTQAVKLLANTGICHDGVKLHGKGFSIQRKEAVALGLGKRKGLEAHIRPYRNGKDLTGRTSDEVRDKMVVDLFGLGEKAVRSKFPELYQHILSTVKPERDKNARLSYRNLWWVFGEPRRELRPALDGLPRYIATVDTAKHRVFQFLDAEMMCDDGVVVIGCDEAFWLGALQSQLHLIWSLSVSGTLEDRPRYFKSLCFDPFPFPEATSEQRAIIAELAEELDATRKAALAEVPGLTMTEIYNLVGWLRGRTDASAPEGEALNHRAQSARAGIVARLHEQIDAAVAAAYGWPADLPPSEIVARLVALNAARAAEEAAGHIRWLRPDYQIPRFGG